MPPAGTYKAGNACLGVVSILCFRFELGRRDQKMASARCCWPGTMLARGMDGGTVEQRGAALSPAGGVLRCEWLCRATDAGNEAWHSAMLLYAV